MFDKKSDNRPSSFIKEGLTILISALVVFTVVEAGSLTPPGNPAATSYTLENIYIRLTTNTASTEADHLFVPSAGPTGTLHTLKQIYDAIPTINAAKVLSGTSYLGVSGTAYGDTDRTKILTVASAAGTYDASSIVSGNVKLGVSFGASGETGSLSPNEGTAVVADLFNGKTAHLTGDWDLDTGTLNLACNTSTFNGTVNLVSGDYDGDGDGSNRWCMTDSGDAVAEDILSGKIAWVDGQAVTGTISSQVLSADSTTVSAGIYSATTLSAVDADLTAANIKKGVALFGVTGTYSGYPGSGWSGTPITQATCDAQNPDWYWFEDGNGDGDTTDAEDGVCVKVTTVDSLSWNGAEQVTPNNLGPLTADCLSNCDGDSISLSSASWTVDAYKYHIVKITAGTGANCWGIVKTNNATSITVYGSWLSAAYASNCVAAPDATSVFSVYDDNYYDNSWIGDWTCDGVAFPNGAPVFHSYPTSAQVGAGKIALASTDCYDGTRDLLPTVDESVSDSRVVLTGTAESGDAVSLTDDNAAFGANVWIGQKVKIFSGTSSGSEGIIESNTNTVLTVSSWSGGNPGSDSQYGIIYIIPRAAYNNHAMVDGDSDDAKQNNGPLQEEYLNNWKGTKLPTSSDFFGFCGYKDGGSNYETTSSANTTNKTYGNYGGQVGRSDEFIDLANTSLEWLSEQYHYSGGRIAGSVACSHFSYHVVSSSYRFRAVFRP